MSFLPDTKRDLRNAQAAAKCALDGHTWAKRRADNAQWVVRCVCCKTERMVARG